MDWSGKRILTIVDTAPIKLGGMEIQFTAVGAEAVQRGAEYIMATRGRPIPSVIKLHEDVGIEVRLRDHWTHEDFPAEMNELLSREDFDLINVHFYSFSVTRSMVPKHLWRRTVIHDRSGPVGVTGIKAWLRKLLIPSFVRRMAGVICDSEYIRRRSIETWRFPPDRLITVHNGAAPAIYEQPAPHEEAFRSVGLEPEDRVILSACRIHELKGIRVLIDAMEHVTQEVPEAKLLCVGPDKQADQFREYAREQNLQGSVFIPGLVDDLLPFLHGSEISVLATLVPEGFPFGLLEAMATSKPVVATATGGTPEMVIDGETGILVEPGDVQAIADGLIRVLKDKDLAMRLGRAGRERVCREFSVQETARKTFEAYGHLLTTARGA